MSDYFIQDAKLADLARIADIYSHYVANSTITFDIEPLTIAEWEDRLRAAKAKNLPFISAYSADKRLLGYALVFPWKPKHAYRFSVESSIYVAPDAVGLGLGSTLLTELMQRCREAGLTEMIAVISDTGAESSIAMHKKFNFDQVGYLPRVGYKFDLWLGTYLMQKSLVGT